MPRFDKAAFQRTERRFALLRKNVRDGLLHQAFNLMIAVQKLKPEALGHGAADSRLAASHEAHQIQIGLHLAHRDLLRPRPCTARVKSHH